MPSQDLQIADDDFYKALPHLAGGLNTTLNESLLDASELHEATNIHSKGGTVLSDTGYKTFRTTVVGNARKPIELVLSSGSTKQLLVTNSRLYVANSGVWEFVPTATTTTLTVTANATDTSVTVASISGFSDGDPISIVLDSGAQHDTTINGAPAGSTITLTDAIPSTATSGNAVNQSLALNGSDDKQISYDVVPTQDWLIFTNGVDVVYKYDGTTVSPLGGLSSSPLVNTCNCVLAFGAYILLGATTESGNLQTTRIRWCDTGAFETWSGGNSGFEDISTDAGQILRMAKMGPYIIAYRQNSFARGEFTNQDNQIFDFETVIRTEGIRSHDSVVVLSDSHIVFANNGIYRYLGDFELQPVGEKVFDLIFGVEGNLNESYRQRITSRYVRELNEIWFVIPTTADTNPTRIIRYELDSETFWIRDLSNGVTGFGFFSIEAAISWNDLDGDWINQTWKWQSAQILVDAPTTLICAGTTIYEYDYLQSTDNGTGITWTLCTKDFYHPWNEFVVDNLTMTASGGDILIEYSVDRGDSWLVYKNVTLDAEQKKRQFWKQFTANRVRWRLSGTGPGFRVQSFGFSFEVATELQQN